MNLNFLKNHELLLGSKSPRRQDLLAALGFKYTLVDIEVEEDFPSELKAEDIALFLCKKKAKAFPTHSLRDKQILITADTIVWLDDECIGKPLNEQDAIQMLQKLSGRQHQVYTGICLKSKYKEIAFYVQTTVEFAELQLNEIIYYVKKYKPYDKAGSYGIQDWIGYVGVAGIKGCYYNVMGFPVQRFYFELEKFLSNEE